MTAPLDGIRVLDLTHMLAGPFCTRALAEMGAEVIKIEPPLKGDATRALPPFKNGRSASFAALNHSKKSLALNLRAEIDQRVFEQLLDRADVLVENHRPGTLERLGYGWDTLRIAHPRLIYAALSGYGQTGPDSAKPAYDLVAQARSGLMALTGEKDGPPVRVGSALSSITAGLYLAQGILAALFDRSRTGTGRRIDVSMLDAQITLLDLALAETTTSGTAPGRAGARDPVLAPCDVFHAADAQFVIAAGNDTAFARLCLCLDLPLEGNPRFASNTARGTHARLLKRLIEAVTIDKPASHWIAKLTAAGVPAAPIATLENALRDPQVVARNMVVDVLEHGRPSFRTTGNPVKMSGLADPPTRPAAPALDAHRGEIMRWLATNGRPGPAAAREHGTHAVSPVPAAHPWRQAGG